MMNVEAPFLFSLLQKAGIVKGDLPQTHQVPSPWYVRTMLGISGWIAAFFLLGFVAIGLEVIIDSDTLSISVGALSMGGAWTLFRKVNNDFVEQFALVLSLAGQALLLYGILNTFDWGDSGPWFFTAALQIVVIVLMSNFLQRLIAGYLVILTLTVALTLLGLSSIAPAVAALLGVLYWLNEFGWGGLGPVLRPAAYGVTIAFIQFRGQMLFDDDLMNFFVHQGGRAVVHLPQWFGEVVTGALLLYVVGRLMQQHGQPKLGRKMLTALFLTAIIVCVSLEAPGITIGIMVMLLGFANSNRVLLGLGIVSLLFYISAYYYTLQATLLTKSATLSATGIVLLLVRWALSNWIFVHREGEHE